MNRALAVLALLALAGCAIEPVKPWEKRALAQRGMRFDADRLEADFARKLHASKEAANGADSVGGGGCGCN